MLSISWEDLEALKANINDLDENIVDTLNCQADDGMLILDYQKERKEGKDAPLIWDLYKSTIRRIQTLQMYHKKKDAKLSNVMNQMVMRRLEEDRKQEKQRN